MRKLFSIFTRMIGFFSGLALFIAVVGLIFAMVGFGRYTQQVLNHQNQVSTSPADGMVILTGGKDRIRAGIALMQSGAAAKLLISGVNQQVSEAALAKEYGLKPELKACCVTIDYTAQNTVGNAKQTRLWVEQNNIKELIVVTNDYHLPRSLVELKQAMPSVDVRPHSVPHPALKAGQWYFEPRAIRLLAFEYSKFMASSLMQDYEKAKARVLAFVEKSFKTG